MQYENNLRKKCILQREKKNGFQKGTSFDPEGGALLFCLI